MSGETDLIARLKPFLRHDGLCGIVGGYGYCTCGLDKALEASDANTVQPDAAKALEWLTDRDNLILFNGVQADGWWEVRRGSVKGEVRGRGATPLDAVQAAMLTASHPKPEPVETQDEASRSPVSEERGIPLVFYDASDPARRVASLAAALEKGDGAVSICGWRKLIADLNAALTPSPQPQAPSDLLAILAERAKDWRHTASVDEPWMVLRKSEYETLARFATDTQPVAGGGAD